MTYRISHQDHPDRPEAYVHFEFNGFELASVELEPSELERLRNPSPFRLAMRLNLGIIGSGSTVIVPRFLLAPRGAALIIAGMTQEFESLGQGPALAAAIDQANAGGKAAGL